MKRALLLPASFFFIIHSQAQASNPNAKPLGAPIFPVTPIQRVEELDKDWKMRVVSTGGSWELANNFSGTVFYGSDWEDGYIRLDNNQLAKNLTLRFNVYTNEIYMKRDTQIMVVDVSIVPIAEFGVVDAGRLVVFRRGFPAVGNNTTATFYEVLASGRNALLRLHKKKMIEKSDINHVPVQELTDAEFLYAYDSAKNTTTEIKHNKNALMDALPGQAEAINTVIQNKKLKMHSDDDLVVLFNELNKE